VGVLGAALIWALAALLSCGDERSTPEEPAPPPSAPDPMPDEAAVVPEWVGAFEWRADPSLESVPSAPVRGVVDGRPFEPVTIFFEPRVGNWAFVIANRALPEPHALLPFGTESANITDLPSDFGVGTRSKPMGPGGGFWQLRADGDDRTTSWNAPNAYALEITKWEIAPFDDQAESILQSAGTASGRVVLVYEATDTFERSWVAGTFTDVPIRYRGPPRWTD
jgi:hypothetical protein